MIIAEKKASLLDELRGFEVFERVPDEAIQWVIDHAEFRHYQEGEELFRPGAEVDHLLLVVRGSYALRMQQAQEFREMGRWGPGYATGLLPFSRMKQASAYGIALEPLEILALPNTCFTAMVGVSYELVQNLVAIMSSRIKTFTELRLQDEKLMSLGKLSAGLAHELNNPAAALVRSAEELYGKVHQSPERFKAVITMRVTPEETDALNAILFHYVQAPTPEWTLLQREAIKDELLDWLEDQGIENGDDLAETFLDFGMTADQLEQMKAAVHGKDLKSILWWVESTLSLERLVAEIREAAERISKLVQSVKVYTHMDQGQDWQPIHLYEGLRSTLTMLKHKIKTNKVELEKAIPAELPPVLGHPGELNQVWTNLIDNALDAMEGGGTLRIQVRQEADQVVVDIMDSGPGIPAELLAKIFDPFFTTKPVGKGTGMGLEIARRIVGQHHGQLLVRSRPGETVFSVHLPLAH